MDYAEADAFLHTRGKPVPRKKHANNTYLHRTEDRGVDYIHLRLHNTDIVTWSHDGLMVLNTGGWLTVTTKDRINSVLPGTWRLLSEKGTWFLSDNYYSDTARRYRFQDGIQMRNTTGWAVGWAVVLDTVCPESKAERDDRHNAMIRKLVARYLKDLPEITADACTLCKPAERVPVNDRVKWVTFGDRMEDTQHLLDHLINGVLPHDLVYAALGERGYLMHLNHGSDTVKRSLRAYLSNRLLVGSTAPQHGRKPVLTSTGATA